jgi:hypothetical protein
MRRSFAILLLVASLALAACGGDDKSDNAGTTSTGPTAATGATGTKSKANAKARARRRAAAKHNARTRTRTRTKTNTKTKSSTQQKTVPKQKAPVVRRAKPGKGTLPTSQSGTLSVAKTVCGGYLAKDIKNRKKTDIAKDYSKAWPANRRQAAYKGCLAGLKLPRLAGSEEG